MAPQLTTRVERWPLASTFTISRGSKSEAVVVVAEVIGAGVRREATPLTLRSMGVFYGG